MSSSVLSSEHRCDTCTQVYSGASFLQDIGGREWCEGKHCSDLDTFNCSHTFACTFDALELLKSFLSGYGLLLLQFADVIISGEQLVEGQQNKHKRSQIPNIESNLLMCLHLHINKSKKHIDGLIVQASTQTTNAKRTTEKSPSITQRVTF